MDYQELIELLRERHLTYVEQVRVADAIESLLAENEQIGLLHQLIDEQKAELAKYRDAPVVGCATTNEEGDLAMLFFDEQEARKYSGDDEPIKLIVKPGEEK